jgi:diaminopimelate epimerase
MSLTFTKMHGLGNDFIVVNALKKPFNLSRQRIAELSQRTTGIGFDQCLVIEPSHDVDVDFFYRIYNANGCEVGQCGNGARCLARFIAHYQLSTKQRITVATSTTRMTLCLNNDESVTVDMGLPSQAPQHIPLATTKQQTTYTLHINDSPCTFYALSLGNPHAVLLCEDILHAPVHTVGAALCTHPFFPEHCNIGFMQRINDHQIKLRVYERGAGETLACGSGAVAAAAVGMLYLGLERQVTVTLNGGDLTVAWPDPSGSLFLTGPASFVFEGTTISV